MLDQYRDVLQGVWDVSRAGRPTTSGRVAKSCSLSKPTVSRRLNELVGMEMLHVEEHPYRPNTNMKCYVINPKGQELLVSLHKNRMTGF